VSSGDVESKQKKHSPFTFPLPRRLDTINIDRWEEEVTSKHQEVSFG
jgi:hypothetical protein